MKVSSGPGYVALVKAARLLKKRTGPVFEVSGSLTCNAVNEFISSEECSIVVNGQTAVLETTEVLLQDLRALKPQLGPAYHVEADFQLKAIAREVPPYGETSTIDLSNVR